MPDELVVTARTQGGVIMGLQHVDAPIYGVQFHPESVLTEGGYRMLGNWLAVAGLPEAALTAPWPLPADLDLGSSAPPSNATCPSSDSGGRRAPLSDALSTQPPLQ